MKFLLYLFDSALRFFLSESAFVDVDNYHENIESKQNKTLENLQEIQEAIVFMNQVWLTISPPGRSA